MKVLLDEDVPVPLVELVRHVLREHHVDHVYSVGWGKKTDINLYRDARARGYEVVVTNNLRQINDPVECDAIKKSGRHVVFYTLESGLQGLALASGAICAAIRPVITNLEGRSEQHLVWITGLAASKRRYTIKNPATDAVSAYWR
jgi:PIN like domain